ncbi:hypothetical protein LHN18_003701 [Acinetobacter baumannii]|nr:hypothetical protein [Acinetobacter baumannii]
MAVAHTTVLSLLGKEVSFQYDRKIEISNTSFITYSEILKGTVTHLVIGLNSEPEISINYGDFYTLSQLLNFQIAHK